MLGNLVANDLRSTIIRVPLLDNDPQTGQPLDYGAFSQALEQEVREHFAAKGVTIRVIGFARS